MRNLLLARVIIITLIAIFLIYNDLLTGLCVITVHGQVLTPYYIYEQDYVDVELRLSPGRIKGRRLQVGIKLHSLISYES